MDLPNQTDSLHPLEIQVLRALGASTTKTLKDPELVQSTALTPSQISMAVGWLLTKQLVSLVSETTTTYVALTEVGAQFQQATSPPEWIIQTVQAASQEGQSRTVKDLQATGQFQPSDLSRAIGLLKKEGVLSLGAGGSLQTTGQKSATVEALRWLLNQINEGSRPLKSFSEDHQALLRQYAVKRGNTQEPFRIDDHTERTYALTPGGCNLLPNLRKDSAKEISQLTPELLKDGSWRNHSFRKYSIHLRPPRLAVGRRHAYRERSLCRNSIQRAPFMMCTLSKNLPMPNTFLNPF
jgi:phenylalanyl-tRNA synthetase alpha chain